MHKKYDRRRQEERRRQREQGPDAEELKAGGGDERDRESPRHTAEVSRGSRDRDRDRRGAAAGQRHRATLKRAEADGNSHGDSKAARDSCIAESRRRKQPSDLQYSSRAWSSSSLNLEFSARNLRPLERSPQMICLWISEAAARRMRRRAQEAAHADSRSRCSMLPLTLDCSKSAMRGSQSALSITWRTERIICAQRHGDGDGLRPRQTGECHKKPIETEEWRQTAVQRQRRRQQQQ